MLLLLLAASAASGPSVALSQPHLDNMPVVNTGNSSDKCPPISRYEAARRGGKLEPNLLDQLPMADAYSAVYRRVGGCVSPVIVRYGVGKP